MYREHDDSIRDFIEEKMTEYNSHTYSKKDFDTFFRMEHRIVVYEKNDIMAFSCIVKYLDGWKMAYTWCSNDGKRAYAKGIDYMIARYSPLYFGEGALKFNKIKRMING